MFNEDKDIPVSRLLTSFPCLSATTLLMPTHASSLLLEYNEYVDGVTWEYEQSQLDKIILLAKWDRASRLHTCGPGFEPSKRLLGFQYSLPTPNPTYSVRLWAHMA